MTDIKALDAAAMLRAMDDLLAAPKGVVPPSAQPFYNGLMGRFDIPAKSMTEAARESIAAAMWKEEALRAQTHGVAARRTPDAFAEEGHYIRDKWLRFADAALAALAEGRG